MPTHPQVRAEDDDDTTSFGPNRNCWDSSETIRPPGNNWEKYVQNGVRTKNWMQRQENGLGLYFAREENNNLASCQGTWFQNSSPFNTPPPTGDSVESLSDLLNMPTARTGDHLPHLYQLRSCVEPSMPGCQNVDFLPWSQNSSPFDNTPPPHGDSISDLLCLNMPRGTLIGNSNPLASPYNVTPAIDTNPPYQGAGIRYGNYQLRYDQTVTVPRKIIRAVDTQYTMPPICPPANSPPIKSTRSSPVSMTSNSNSPNESNSSTSMGDMTNSNYMNNTVAVQPNSVVCQANDQEWTNLQNAYALQRRQQDCDPHLMDKIIERTGRLLLAAVHNDQAKCVENYEVYNNGQVDKQQRFQRNLNVTVNSEREVSCTWVGELPPKNHKQPFTYSCKVFAGGLPWDITELALIQAFSRFGSVKVEWPKKDGIKEPKGFAYLILESEKKVRSLMDSCFYNYIKMGDFYKIPARKIKSKETQVEIIPWVVANSNFAKVSQKLDPQKTVFVGALHGMIHAEALAKIMSDLFGAVVYAGLDTDKYKYPIGSGRVTFSTHHSYMKAVLAAFIEVKTSKFSKKVQINPYLEDSPCSACSVQQGPYFCRDITCFRYFCRGCWKWQHSSEAMRAHQHLTRGSKNKNIAGAICTTHSTIWD